MSTTFFDKLARNYTQVIINEKNEVDVVTFLEATEAMFALLDLLGSTAFSPVKSDMAGNVAKIRTKFLSNPVAYPTLQSIVLAEKKENKMKGGASEGLLWLKRGLEFTSQALRRNTDDQNEELSVSFQLAYQNSLSKYHSFLVKPIFSVYLINKDCYEGLSVS